jgi:hypothetical protein
MSTSVYVKFFLNGKKQIAKTAYLNSLKQLLEGWSWADELQPVYDKNYNKEAGLYWFEEFIGYLPKDKITDELKARIKDNIIHFEKEENIDSLEFVEVDLREVHSDDFKEKYVRVYGYKKENYSGNWFNIDSFYKAKIKFEQKEKEFKNELERLLRLKDSIGYYTLTSEQKTELDEDIEYHRDMLEDYGSKVYICQYMIDTLDMMKDMYYDDWNDECIAFIYLA